MENLEKNTTTKRHIKGLGKARGGLHVKAQTMYTHVGKCKNVKN
jgi:hypothetical protein